MKNKILMNKNKHYFNIHYNFIKKIFLFIFYEKIYYFNIKIYKFIFFIIVKNYKQDYVYLHLDNYPKYSQFLYKFHYNSIFKLKIYNIKSFKKIIFNVNI